MTRTFIKAALLAAAMLTLAQPVAKQIDVSFFAVSEAFAGPATYAPRKHKNRVAGHSRFIFGRLKCAANVNAWLRRHGLRGTGSLAAASFLRFPRVSIHKANVMVTDRPGKGHHAAVVLGNGQCLNPSQNEGWRVKPCYSIWRGYWRVFVRAR